MRNKKKQAAPIKPKAVEIREPSKGNENFSLHKVWPGGKTSEAFVLTDDPETLFNEYHDACKKWGLKPDMARVRSLAKKYDQ